MVNLLDVAAREFAAGRSGPAMKILKDGLGWSFHRCWQAKSYSHWTKTKLAEENRGAKNDN